MNFTEYSPLALRTAKPLTQEQNIKHALILMISEAGEIADAIKAYAIYGKPLDKANVLEEVGDLLWGLNLYLTSTGQDLSLVDTAVSDYEFAGRIPSDDVWRLVDAAITVGAFASGVHSSAKSGQAFGGTPATLSAHFLCCYLVLILDYIGSDFSQALEVNIAKLAKRYGDKYSDYKAVNRDLSAERLVLEGGDAKAS